MRVAEMSELPKQAGVAVLEWSEEISLPHREKEVIRLPKGKHTDSEYYPLKGGAQFLFNPGGFDINHSKSGDRFDLRTPWDWENPNYVIFGGTDESPFMAMLRPEALLEFLKAGEQGFFEALKPPIIKRAEQIWGKDKTRRQGDFFIYPMTFDWYEFFNKCYRDEGAGFPGLVKGLYFEKNQSLFCTRHAFSGLLYRGSFWIDEIGPLSYTNEDHYNRYGLYHDDHRVALGQGLIEAEDHRSLKLEVICLIAQAELLINKTDTE